MPLLGPNPYSSQCTDVFFFQLCGSDKKQAGNATFFVGISTCVFYLLATLLVPVVLAASSKVYPLGNNSKVIPSVFPL